MNTQSPCMTLPFLSIMAKHSLSNLELPSGTFDIKGIAHATMQLIFHSNLKLPCVHHVIHKDKDLDSNVKLLHHYHVAHFSLKHKSCLTYTALSTRTKTWTATLSLRTKMTMTSILVMDWENGHHT